jgi:hypothetical protein
VRGIGPLPAARFGEIATLKAKMVKISKKRLWFKDFLRVAKFLNIEQGRDLEP